MTARSTRKAAEQEIIDAAYRWYNTYINDLHEGYAQSVLDLKAAVVSHQALGAAEVGQPAFSNNSTDTSAEAGSSMRNLTGFLAFRCFEEIDRAYLGCTVDELEVRLVRSHQSVSARVNELRDKGWVRDSGERRKTRSGRNAIVWTPTDQAKGRRDG